MGKNMTRNETNNDLDQWLMDYSHAVYEIIIKLSDKLDSTSNNSDDRLLFDRIFDLLLDAESKVFKLHLQQTMFLIKNGVGRGYLQKKSDFLYLN